MEIIICKDYEEISKKAGKEVIDLLKSKPAATLGLATGSSPIGIYNELIRAYREGEITFESVKSFNLDEYVGLDRNHPQSYYSFMHEHLFDKVNIKEENIHIPYVFDLNKGFAACKKYSKLLENTEIDLQILGIGSNGHIGFNEPGTPFTQRTFIVNLTDKTRQDNKRFFSSLEEVPTKAITMGLVEIVQAKRIILIASGAPKAMAIAKLLNGPIGTKFPASILRSHPNVTIFVDKAAASLIEGVIYE